MVQRSIILIGRHGIAPKNADGSSMDSITDDSIKEMCIRTGGEFRPYIVETLGIRPAEAFVLGSGKVRTMYTGKAKAIGALGLQRPGDKEKGNLGIAQNSDDLANFNFEGVSLEEDPRFNFGDPFANMAVYKATGGAGNVNYWLANPTARTHEGKPIESYESLSSRTRFGVQDVVRRVVDDGKRFGIVTSHATVVEPALINLVNSGIAVPVQCVEDIGGMLAQEEHARLEIDETDAGTYAASLFIKGLKYPVNLQELFERS